MRRPRRSGRRRRPDGCGCRRGPASRARSRGPRARRRQAPLPEGRSTRSVRREPGSPTGTVPAGARRPLPVRSIGGGPACSQRSASPPVHSPHARQAGNPRRRRRSARPSGRRARPARAVRGRLPGHRRGIRGRCARGRPRADPARRSGRAVPRRPAHADDDRHRVPRRGAPTPARRQARPADGLRRHRRRDPGDQRDPARPVPAEAVGPSRGEAVPGRRRPARGLGRRLPSGVRGAAAAERPMGAARPRDPRLPDAQPGAVHLARSGHRRGRPAPGRVARRAGRRDASGHRPARWAQPSRSRKPRAGRRDRDVDARRPALLRPRHRRRWPGRACRRGLRGQRGPEDAHGRARGARRPGRHDEPDRELSRLSVRPERQRPRAAGVDPGEAPRRRDPVIAGGDDDSARGSVSVRRARRRHGGLLPGRDRDDRGELSAARGPGRGGARRRRRVLRRRHDRGEAVPAMRRSPSSARATRPARRSSTSRDSPGRSTSSFAATTCPAG